VSAKTPKPKVPVSVCRHEGSNKLWWGKFKDPETGAWMRIPGGVFPPKIDSKAKALEFAAAWYVAEVAQRAARVAEKVLTWPDICDRYIQHIQKGKGKAATKHEATVRARYLRSSPILCGCPTAQHDEMLVLEWLRAMSGEPVRGGSPRAPKTVRNVCKVLREIYRYARSARAYPQSSLPTDGYLYERELKGIMATDEQQEVMCPVESVMAVIACKVVSQLDRTLIHVAALTGMRPGELYGLRFQDIQEDRGVLVFSLREQLALRRGKQKSQLTLVKTRWSIRLIPVHPELLPVIEAWRSRGWEGHVGRAPRAEDFLFPDPKGKPHREDRADGFREVLASAGAPTTYEGHPLGLGKVRKTFVTMAMQAGVDPRVRRKLMGHSPTDTMDRAYEIKEPSYLYQEICKIPGLLEVERPLAKIVPLQTAVAAR